MLLPGLDGTGRLFGPLVERLPEWLSPQVVAYPPDEPESFEQVCDRVAGELAGLSSPFVLLGESFSGPVAIRLAARRPPGLRGVVLAASFARSPLGSWGPFKKPIASLLRARPPRWAVRLLLTGAGATAITDQTLAAIRTVDRRVVANRVEQVLSIDVTQDLKRCPVPVLYLRGERDRLVRPRVCRQLQEALPSLQVVPLDAPHLVLQRRPREAAAAIADFASELDRS